ncbi:hypothetical protein CVIRNUC_000092 [Coccomyxa viridis]|uniref:U-box domain-containing protein n=1 Tax=Coccomyxa viridis TaxID=1274662 RepID=A0AAV1HQG3_9CHLO|nr:hypothetical protein CVIRNUC_000092 [Coccomyxa viridis]
MYLAHMAAKRCPPGVDWRLDQTAKTLLAQPKASPNPAAGRRSVSFELDMTMLAGLPAPPEEFICPLSQCLMTEPVTLINTGVTLQRSSAQKWFRTRSNFCPVTGQPIHGWVVMQTNYELRALIEQWAAKQGVDLEALDRPAKLMTSRSLPL